METISPNRKIVLVSCVSRKRNEPTRAKDLYTSQWFIKARAYAELYGDELYILSALWGLVSPEQIIKPYNQSLNEYKKKERDDWASRVAKDIYSRVPKGSSIIILAGRKYRQGLVARLENEGYRVEVPMLELGIGKQLRYLNEAIESDR